MRGKIASMAGAFLIAVRRGGAATFYSVITHLLRPPTFDLRLSNEMGARVGLDMGCPCYLYAALAWGVTKRSKEVSSACRLC